MFPKMVRNWYTQWLISGPGLQSSLKPSLFHLTPLCGVIFSDLHTSLSTVQEMKNEQWQAMTLSDWGWCHPYSSGRSKENLAQRNDQCCDLTHPLILRASKFMRSQNDGGHLIKKKAWAQLQQGTWSLIPLLSIWSPCSSSTHVPISSRCDLIFQPSPVIGGKL